ncbi:MAG TPA: hypothetical protein VLC73_16670 [Burkholderiales bacterium]|nr:hypothetical protein [Burkholderiales bacterium]
MMNRTADPRIATRELPRDARAAEILGQVGSLEANTILVRRRHVLITTGVRHIALCAVSLVISGCISINSVKSEETFSAPPDTSRVCAYTWNIGETLLRTENIISYGWASPRSFGYGATLPHIEQLGSSCPFPRPERTANLSVYYLEHANKLYNTFVLTPLFFGSLYTLGIAPIPYFRNYVACVQTTSADGLGRFAIAEGSISTLGNVWGMGNTRHHQGKTEMIALRAKLLQDLTSQAWHKLWQLDAENLGAEGCRHRIETMVGRSESRNHKSDAITLDLSMNRVESDRSASQAIATQPLNEDYLTCVTRGVGKCDDLVNCVANGERQWTNRSKCD